jgi:hypothetical protein
MLHSTFDGARLEPITGLHAPGVAKACDLNRLARASARKCENVCLLKETFLFKLAAEPNNPVPISKNEMPEIRAKDIYFLLILPLTPKAPQGRIGRPCLSRATFLSHASPHDHEAFAAQHPSGQSVE